MPWSCPLAPAVGGDAFVPGDGETARLCSSPRSMDEKVDIGTNMQSRVVERDELEKDETRPEWRKAWSVGEKRETLA